MTHQETTAFYLDSNPAIKPVVDLIASNPDFADIISMLREVIDCNDYRSIHLLTYECAKRGDVTYTQLLNEQSIYAAINKKWATPYSLYTNGADVNYYNEEGDSLLSLAMEQYLPITVVALINEGASLLLSNVSDRTIAHFDFFERVSKIADEKQKKIDIEERKPIVKAEKEIKDTLKNISPGEVLWKEF